MKNLFATTEASSRKQEQDRIVNYIKQHVELTNGNQIKKIEFIDFQKNEMTGFWRVSSKINDKNIISFEESKISGEIELSNYSPKYFRILNETSKKNSNDISIIYYEDKLWFLKRIIINSLEKYIV
ncbi:hypothetical protein [Streptococcus agalactiae]|uniref:hypothetical protein n=2 Tax=Streptococcus agalactiae TaxID=1311 RepID=UPI003C754601